MPIRPEQLARYPKGWRAISRRIRFERAGGRCECDGRCGRDRLGRPLWHLDDTGRCVRRHGDPLPGGWLVILTTAHLDHTPEHCDDDNLLAMCQACHLAYDAAHHAETRRARGRSTEPMLPL